MTSQISTYCADLFNRKRLATIEVRIGNVIIGGENALCLQSMTTTNTMDTEKSVAQSIRMIDAGCEIVRLTAPSKNEALNLKNIRASLKEKGYSAPLVADINFCLTFAIIAYKDVKNSYLHF